VNRGRDPLIGASLPSRVAGVQVAPGYTDGETISSYHSSASFSLSTFLCVVASWAVVDKNIHTIFMFSFFVAYILWQNFFPGGQIFWQR